MFTDFEQVHRELIRVMFGCNIVNGKYAPFKVNLPYNGGTFDVTPSFYKRGAKDYTETKDMVYPCVILETADPELDQSRYYPEQPNYGEMTDEDADGKDDTIKLFPFPLPMIFTYEISVCTKSERHQNALSQYMDKHFMYEDQRNKGFIMNVGSPPVQTFYGPDCVDADYVKFSFRHVTDPKRSDGVHESLYELALYPYMYLREAIAVPMVQNINIGLGRVQK